MRLRELMAELAHTVVQGDSEIEITGVAVDSRRVKPGDLFICVRGAKDDGHRFLPSAFAAGAVAALIDRTVDLPAGLTVAAVENVQDILAELAARFYGYPARHLTMLGVVGTNGKTTSTYLIRSVLETAGYAVGLIGTIQNLIKNRVLPAANTTPGPLELQALLAAMVDEGCSHVVMEVSSHAIALGRTRGCPFIGGVFTNLTQDHLDFHQTFADYVRVKKSFFADLPPAGWAVINGDDPESAGFLAATKARCLTYGLRQDNSLRAEQVRVRMDGVSFRAVTPAGAADLRLHFTGHFNVYNSLGALGAGLASGIDLPVIVRGLEAVSGVPGRFQLVPTGLGFGVVVDYAHTDDGLDNLLRTARQLTRGRLLVVFGCGGDRDRGKRPLMGRVAAKYGDLVLVTSDNPRSEDPVSIIKEIEAGLTSAGKVPGEYRLIPDREQAIRSAVAEARPQDLVVIAGKGHETYQQFAERTIHFDDREVVAAALEDKKNGLLAKGSL